MNSNVYMAKINQLTRSNKTNQEIRNSIGSGLMFICMKNYDFQGPMKQILQGKNTIKIMKRGKERK